MIPLSSNIIIQDRSTCAQQGSRIPSWVWASEKPLFQGAREEPRGFYDIPIFHGHSSKNDQTWYLSFMYLLMDLTSGSTGFVGVGGQDTGWLTEPRNSGVRHSQAVVYIFRSNVEHVLRAQPRSKWSRKALIRTVIINALSGHCTRWGLKALRFSLASGGLPVLIVTARAMPTLAVALGPSKMPPSTFVLKLLLIVPLGDTPLGGTLTGTNRSYTGQRSVVFVVSDAALQITRYNGKPTAIWTDLVGERLWRCGRDLVP